MHLLIIGGSDAGISAALRARELDASTEVTMALADDFPNFSICGLPYYLSGETPDWRDPRIAPSFPALTSFASTPQNPSTLQVNPSRSETRRGQRPFVMTV